MKYVCYDNIIYIFNNNCSSVTYLEQTILNEESLEIILQKTGIKTIDFSNINEPYDGFESIISKYPVKKLPETLKKLDIDYIIYNDDIVKLPDSLEILKCKINVRTSNLESTKFPDNIKQLDVIWYTSNYQDQIIFPSNLETLKIKISKPITLENFPNTLKILDLSADCRIYYEKLPDSLEVIYLDDEFNRSTDIFSNCKNLKKISFGKFFNKSIKFLPDSIEEIELGTSFCQKIAKIPSNLKSIKFHKKHATYYKFAKDFPHITIL
jgi:hypothetical protein